MLNILAISYHNIGPLYEQPLSVFFHQGKFLINAPIGTGKSFLFFDGPLYGLYKYSDRKLLNNLSNNGYLKILFTLGEQTYLIIRDLTPGKTKDSCSSSLWTVQNFDIKILQGYNTISLDLDIQEILKIHGVKTEQIPFKNEVDLNMGISDLLPPREVFVNTMFLLQDSGNIFELTPANRLLVLKNIFGLLGVDEIKDKMAQIKRDIQTQKKVYSSTEEVDKKLKSLLGKLLEQITNAEEYIDMQKYREALEDLRLIYDAVNIEKFALDSSFFALQQDLELCIQTLSTSYTTLKTRAEQSEKNIATLTEHIKEYTTRNNDITQQKIILQQQIAELDEKKLEILKAKKSQFLDQISAFSDFADRKKLLDFVSDHPDLFIDLKLREEFSDYKNIIQTLIDQGKILKLEQENLQARNTSHLEEQKNLEKSLAEFDITQQGAKYQVLYQQKLDTLIYQTEITIKEERTEIEYLQKEYIRLEQTTADLQQKIVQYEKILQEKRPFYDEVLAGKDFASEIQKSSYVDIEFELEKYKNQQIEMEKELGLNSLQQNIIEKQKNLEVLEKKLATIQQDARPFLEDFFVDLAAERESIVQQLSTLKSQQDSIIISENIEKIGTQIVEIKTFLGCVSWKQILEDYEKYLVVQKDLKSIDTQITQYEQQIEKIQKYRDDITMLGAQQQSCIQQIAEYTEKLNLAKIEFSIGQEKLTKIDTSKIQKGQTLVRYLDNTLHALKTLIDDFAEILIKIKKLHHDEGLAKNLYNALSKDLILFVLEDNLPILNDIINNFLSNIVEFQIDMKLEQKGSSLELHTMIVDQQGKKETRSLSGGQKVILKLVWMLAVSVYSQSKMLFLDETINNLDPDAVAKVSELLQNFSQQNNIKMYVVTHSTEIKSMNIWDGIIDLGQLLL